MIDEFDSPPTSLSDALERARLGHRERRIEATLRALAKVPAPGSGRARAIRDFEDELGAVRERLAELGGRRI